MITLRRQISKLPVSGDDFLIPIKLGTEQIKFRLADFFIRWQEKEIVWSDALCTRKTKRKEGSVVVKNFLIPNLIVWRGSEAVSKPATVLARRLA
jgi:hypothetical protein